MKRLIEKVVLIVIAIMLITVGCGPNALSQRPTHRLHLYCPHSLQCQRQPQRHPFPSAPYSKGSGLGKINADGSYNSKSELADENGIYTVVGNQISIMGDYSSCLGIVGIYTWTLDGNMLILTQVDDDQCTNRRNVTDGKWRIEP